MDAGADEDGGILLMKAWLLVNATSIEASGIPTIELLISPKERKPGPGQSSSTVYSNVKRCVIGSMTPIHESGRHQWKCQCTKPVFFPPTS